VSQPFNQRATFSPLGSPDTAAGEFWLGNPWEEHPHNLSAFETNAVLLNTGNGRLIDVSHLTDANIDSDSRAVVVGDVTGDGMPDLLVRGSGGGPLRVFENRWPKTNSVTIRLRGVRSNSLGIGAKLTLQTNRGQIHRELYPHNSFLSQLPAEVHFGLKDVDRIVRLTVLWPSGTTQVVTDLGMNHKWEITEDQPTPKQLDNGSSSHHE
jgi:hypothetical protein